MKTKHLILFLLMLPLVMLAQTNTNTVPAVPVPGANSTGLLYVLIPLGVPILVAIAKFLLPKLPSWTLPILAPALGALADYLTTLVTGTAGNPLVGAALGSAGVGLREIIDQVKQKISPVPPA